MGAQDSVKPTQPPGCPASPWPSPQRGERPSPVVSTFKKTATRVPSTYPWRGPGARTLASEGQLCSMGSAGAAGGPSSKGGAGSSRPLPAPRQDRRESRHIFHLRCHGPSEMRRHTRGSLRCAPAPAHRVARVYSLMGQLLQYLLGTCYVPGAALGARDILVRKKKQNTGAAFVSFTC